MKIVLASESPFRKRALEMLGLAFETRPSRIDEKAIRHDDPARLTLTLAEAKARKIAEEFLTEDCADAVIVSGDAVAAKDTRIFEKPRSKAEAAEFLKDLSGCNFQFVTALAVLHTRTEKMLSTVETLTISFRRLLDREIEDYIGKYPVLSYAGAFEDDAVHRFSERIEGSYNIGTALPVSRLVLFLREQGVDI